MNISQHFPILVIITLFTGAYLAPLAGLWKRKLCYPLAVLSALLSFLFSVGILLSVLEHGIIRYHVGGWEPPWGIELLVDPLSAFMALIVSFIGLLAVVYSKDYIAGEIPDKKLPAYYSLLQLIIGGMLGALMTGDLFNLFVMTEIFSISAYALVSIAQKKGSLIASYNYLILASVGTTFILFSTGFIYMVTGSLNMVDISQRLSALESPWVMYNGLILLVIGFAIKSALFPLHTWLPDAHSIAPSPVSVLLSALVIKVGAYSIIRSVFTVFGPGLLEQSGVVTIPVTWMASLGILLGSIYAITQTDIKRMLAYSSVAHIGYILLGIGLASTASMTGGIFHILNHALGKACLFFCAGAVLHKTGIRNVEEYTGLAGKMPITMIAFTLAAISLVGIPPTSGFMSKFYLAIGAYQESWIFLAVILLGSLLSAVFYFRVINLIYFGEPEHKSGVREQGAEIGGVVHRQPTTDNRREAPLTMLIPIIILALGSTLFGILVHIPLSVVEPAVKLLLGM